MTDQIEDWLSGGPELERVVELNQRTSTRDGLPVTLVSLEVWANSIRLVYVVTTLDPRKPSDSDEFDAWHLSDEHGTAFAFAGGSGGGDGLRMYSNLSWTPRPDRAATTLRVRNEVLGIDVSVPLSASSIRRDEAG